MHANSIFADNIDNNMVLQLSLIIGNLFSLRSISCMYDYCTLYIRKFSLSGFNFLT